MAIYNKDQESQLTPLQQLALYGGQQLAAAPAPAPAPAPTPAPAPAPAPTDLNASLGITDAAASNGFLTPGFSTDANGNVVTLQGTAGQNPDTAFVGSTIGSEGNPNGTAPSGLPVGGDGTQPADMTPTGTGATAGDTTGAAAGDGGAAGGQSVSDYIAEDPAYAAQKAEDDRLLNQAASGTLASAKDMLLGFGSQELAKSYLDKLLQDPRVAAIFTPADESAFLSQISANPDTAMSTLARIARSQRQRAQQTDEGFNQGNLFYSGARAQGLGDQAYNFLGEKADATGKITDALSRLQESYLQAQNAARSGDVSGFQAAYDRALQEALQFGTGTDPTDKTSGATSSTGQGNTSQSGKSTTTKTRTPSAAKPTRPKAMPTRQAPVLVSENGRGQGGVAKKKKGSAAPVGGYRGRH